MCSDEFVSDFIEEIKLFTPRTCIKSSFTDLFKQLLSTIIDFKRLRKLGLISKIESSRTKRTS